MPGTLRLHRLLDFAAEDLVLALASDHRTAVAVRTWDRRRDRESVCPVGPSRAGTAGRALARAASARLAPWVLAARRFLLPPNQLARDITVPVTAELFASPGVIALGRR
jgi:hypothetical protein